MKGRYGVAGLLAEGGVGCGLCWLPAAEEMSSRDEAIGYIYMLVIIALRAAFGFSKTIIDGTTYHKSSRADTPTGRTYSQATNNTSVGVGL